MTPKVTVVMTAYNARSTIAAAVESVLQQSFTDLELLVLDDGSSDETVAALAAITDPRLRVEIRAHRGRPAALNEALTLAIGEYIALNDADRERFVSTYAAALREAYPMRSDGVTLFPFRRLFMVATV